MSGATLAPPRGPSTSPLGVPRHDVLPIVLIAAGFFFGMIFVPQLLRWALLIQTSFGLHGGDFLGAPKRRLLWAAPFILLLHPLPYLIVGTVVFTGLAALGRVSVGWLWFLDGFYTYALLMGVLLVTTLLRARRRTRGAGNA
jgi:hypothetical protein